MRINNSMFAAFWRCPTYTSYAHIQGLQKPTPAYFEFGKRFHKLLEEHYLDHSGQFDWTPAAPLEDAQLEAEVQVMYQAYLAAYPVETFEVIECEKVFELPIAEGRHSYVGMIDMSIGENGRMKILETKTESRNSKRNSPRSWAARSQASLYSWAATQLYQEPVDSVILNVCTKASPKGQVGPSFRRDVLERTPLQVEQALRDLIWVADRLEEMQESGSYPRNTNSCVNEFGFDCSYYSLCHIGISPETLSEFVTVEPFAHLEL